MTEKRLSIVIDPSKAKSGGKEVESALNKVHSTGKKVVDLMKDLNESLSGIGTSTSKLKSIDGIFSKLANDVKGASTSFISINRSLRAVEENVTKTKDSFKEVNRTVVTFSGRLEKSVSSVDNSMKKLLDRSNEVRTSMTSLRNETNKLSTRTNTASGNVKDFSDSTKIANTSIGKLVTQVDKMNLKTIDTSYAMNEVRKATLAVGKSQDALATKYDKSANSTENYRKRLVMTQKALTDLKKTSSGLSTQLERTDSKVKEVGNAFTGLSQSMKAASKGLNSAVNRLERMQKELDSTKTKLKETTANTHGMKSAVNGLAGALAGVSFAEATRGLVNMSDEFTNAKNRIAVVSDANTDVAATMDRLLDLSIETRSSFSATTDIYQKVTRATQVLGKSQEDIFSILSTVSKAVTISGASVQAANGAMIQFAQGLSNNFQAAGAELNSIIEQTPGLAEAIARGIGVSVNELKKLGEAGQLNTELVVEGLEKVKGYIDGQFNKSIATISSRWQNVTDALTMYVGQTEAMQEVSSKVVTLLEDLAKNMSEYDTELKAVTASLIVLGSAAVLGGLAQLALLLGPAGAIVLGIAAITAGIVYVYDYATALEEMGKEADNSSGFFQTLATDIKAVTDQFLDWAMRSPAEIAVNELAKKDSKELQELLDVQTAKLETLAMRMKKLNEQAKGEGFFGSSKARAEATVVAMNNTVDQVVRLQNALDDAKVKQDALNEAQLRNHHIHEMKLWGIEELEKSNLLYDNLLARLDPVAKEMQRYKKIIDEINKGNFEAAKKEKLLSLARKDHSERLESLTNKTDEYKKGSKGLTAVLNTNAGVQLKLRQKWDEIQEAVDNNLVSMPIAIKAYEEFALKVTGAADAIDDFNKSANKGVDLYYKYNSASTEALKKTSKYKEQVANLQAAVDSGRISQKQMNETLDDYVNDVTGATKANQDFADSIADAFVDGFDAAMESGESFRDWFKDLLGDLLKTAASNQIKIALGAQPSGATFGDIGNFFTGGGSSGGASFGVTDVASSLLSNPVGAALGSTVGAQAGTVMADIALSSFGEALGLSAGGTVTTTGGSLISGAASMAGPLLATAAIPLVLGALGPEPSDKTMGSQVNLMTGGLTTAGGGTGDKFSQANQDIATAAGTLASSFATFLAEETGNEVNQQLSFLIGERDGMRIRLDQQVVETATSTEDLLNKTGMVLADLFGFQADYFDRLKQEGESFAQTVMRVEGQFDVLETATKHMGLNFKATGEQGREAANVFAQHSGGFAEMTSSLDNFYTKFFSEEERAEDVRQTALDEVASLNETLGLTGENALTGADSFKEFVLAQDLSTNSGAKAVAQALESSWAFETLAESAKLAAEALENDFNRAMGFVESNIMSSQQRIAKTTQESRDVILQWGETLRASNGSLIDTKEEYLDYINSFEVGSDAYKQAVVDTEDLAKAIDALSDSASDATGSIGSSGGSTSTPISLSQAESNLNAATSAVNQFSNVIDQTFGGVIPTLAQFNAEFGNIGGEELSQLQSDFSGIISQIGGLSDSVSGLQDAYFSQFDSLTLVDPIDDIGSQIADVYQSVLGRLPDQAGLDYWKGLVEDGVMTVSDVLSEVQNSAEAANYSDFKNLIDAYKEYEAVLNSSGFNVTAMKAALKDYEDAQKVYNDVLRDSTSTTTDALDDLGSTATDTANQVSDSTDLVALQIKLLQLQGKDLEALAIIRERELTTVNDAGKVILEQIHAQEDLNALRDADLKRETLQIKLLELQGNAEEALAITRRRQLDATDDLGKQILQQIFDLEDAKAEADRVSAEVKSQTESSIAALMEQYNDELKVMNEAHAERISQLEAEKDAINTIQSVIDNIRLSDVSPLTPEQRLEEARSQYERVLGRAQSGDLDALGQLDTASSNLLQEASSFYASSDDFIDIFNDVESQLVSLRDQFGTVESIDEQIRNVNQQHLSATEDLATQLGSDLAKLITNTETLVLINNAIATLPADIAALINAAVARSTPQVTVTQSGGGTSTRTVYPDGNVKIADSFNRKPLVSETFTFDGSHRNGLDEVPYDGYIAELHRGERVQTAQAVQEEDEMMSALLEEVKGLRSDLNTANARIEMMQEEQLVQTENQTQTIRRTSKKTKETFTSR